MLRLLEMLHKDELVTRTMIAEHVWDIHFDSSSNVINVFINYLRAKIDDGHLVKLIRTVHGRGYRLSGDWQPVGAPLHRPARRP